MQAIPLIPNFISEPTTNDEVAIIPIHDIQEIRGNASNCVVRRYSDPQGITLQKGYAAVLADINAEVIVYLTAIAGTPPTP